MATETLRPNGSVTTNWPSLTGASHHAATSDDSDTTYIRNNTTTPQTDVLDLTNTALTTETINSVDVRFRVRSETSAVGECQVGVRLSGVDTMGVNRTSIPTAATDYSDTGLARPGGGSWAVSDLNSLQVVAIGDGNTTALRCFELYVDIQYTAGGGTQNIDAGFISSGVTTYGPSVSPGAVNISPSFIAAGVTLYAPTVSPGAVSISAGLINSALQLYAVTVSAGVSNINAGFVAATTQVYTPALSPGAISLSAGFINSGHLIYTPTLVPGVVSTQPGIISSTAVTYLPTLTLGSVNISVDYISSVTVIPTPSVVIPSTGNLEVAKITIKVQKSSIIVSKKTNTIDVRQPVTDTISIVRKQTSVTAVRQESVVAVIKPDTISI